MTINEVAQFVNGTVIGDGTITVKSIAAHDIAREGDITFALGEEELELASKSKASCILATISMEDCPKTILKVSYMKQAITILYNVLLEIEIPSKSFTG